MVSTSKLAASSGTTALSNFNSPSSLMRSKFAAQIFFNSFGMGSSQSKRCWCNILTSSLRPAVIGATLPEISKISDATLTQSRLVRTSGIKPFDITDFLPRTLLLKLSSLIFSIKKSPLGNHFIPPTITDSLSSLKCSAGSSPLIVKPFKLKPPGAKATGISSVTRRVSFLLSVPLKQSSTYVSCTIASQASGNWSLDNSAVRLKPHSAWLPLDRIPYIAVLMTFHRGSSSTSRLSLQRYNWYLQ